MFEVQSETLEKYPDTLLGSYSDRRRYEMLASDCSQGRILLLKQADPIVFISYFVRYFLEDRQEYFLERNRLIFGSILYFYQSQGRLYRPTCVTEEQYLEEIR